MEYTIAQAAKKMNVTTHTLRYYDREGLLPYVGRTKTGSRFFTEKDLEWVNLISCLKNTGMHIKEIKTFIEWCVQGDSTLEKRLQLFWDQRRVVEQQMKDLKKTLDKIDYKIWYYQTACDAGTEEIHKDLKCIP